MYRSIVAIACTRLEVAQRVITSYSICLPPVSACVQEVLTYTCRYMVHANTGDKCRRTQMVSSSRSIPCRHVSFSTSHCLALRAYPSIKYCATSLVSCISINRHVQASTSYTHMYHLVAYHICMYQSILGTAMVYVCSLVSGLSGSILMR
jgi:hypothetical protein